MRRDRIRTVDIKEFTCRWSRARVNSVSGGGHFKIGPAERTTSGRRGGDADADGVVGRETLV